MYMRSVLSPARSFSIGDFLSAQRAVRQSMLDEAFQASKSHEAKRCALKVRLDVREDDQAFYLVADLPGVDQKDVELTFDDGLLTLKGEKKAAVSTAAEGKEKIHLIERSVGTFERQISLSAPVDASKISASFEKGVLTVKLPKQPEPASTAHKIDIKSV